jgi:hypothetical protein
LPYFYSDELDDSPAVDSDQELSGTKNDVPAELLEPGLCYDMVNRLASKDGLNRPRPGFNVTVKPDATNRVCGLMYRTSLEYLTGINNTWYKIDNDVASVAAGGPAFSSNDNINGVTAQGKIYFSFGTRLYSYDGTAFAGPINLNGGISEPNVQFPVYFNNILFVAKTGTNTIYGSGILDFTLWDIVNRSVQLDEAVDDAITGMTGWQNNRLIVFKKGATYAITADPTQIAEATPDGFSLWQINKVSNTIGCAEHRTIAQAGTNVFFLSESGRGVYALGQSVSSDQLSAADVISQDIKPFINRINWASIKKASAVAWNDLYMLSVPLDNSSEANAVLVYSISLGKWQGVWEGYRATVFAQNYQATGGTDLYFGREDGWIGKQFYPEQRIYQDREQGVPTSNFGNFDSSLTTRAFIYGEKYNQVCPYNVILEFFESDQPFTLDAIRDASLVQNMFTGPTVNSGLSIPIPIIPFDIGVPGFKKTAVGIMDVGPCTQVQFKLRGSGNWTILGLTTSAFADYPLKNE